MPVDSVGTVTPMPPVAPGVWTKKGVVLNSRMRGFLAALRAKSGQNIVVTSGTRTVDAQASAMFGKVSTAAAGGTVLRGGDGLNIYSAGLADEIREGGTGSKAEIAATLTKQVARGTFMSRHMRGDALDLRVRGLTPSERGRLKEVVTELGANHLDEGDHIHVEDLPPTFAAADPAAWGSVLLAGVAIWFATSD